MYRRKERGDYLKECKTPLDQCIYEAVNKDGKRSLSPPAVVCARNLITSVIIQTYSHQQLRLPRGGCLHRVSLQIACQTRQKSVYQPISTSNGFEIKVFLHSRLIEKEGRNIHYTLLFNPQMAGGLILPPMSICAKVNAMILTGFRTHQFLFPSC